jgi:hypothetical protein
MNVQTVIPSRGAADIYIQLVVVQTSFRSNGDTSAATLPKNQVVEGDWFPLQNARPAGSMFVAGGGLHRRG